MSQLAPSSHLPAGQSVLPRSLEHPLPTGMRDLLPGVALERRTLARAVLKLFRLHGYALVTPPLFEFAEVLERGLGTLDPADVLRFVEPESGEVAALRPDMTPQIARIIATRLSTWPAPFRLCYEGSILRRRSGRARKHRQILQVGVELAGIAGPEGDLELLALASDALRAAGLAEFAIDMGDAGILRALLAELPAELATSLSRAMAKKDETELADRARDGRVACAPMLRRLLDLQGGREAIIEGLRLLHTVPTAAAAAHRLLELFDAADARGLSVRLSVDLGEVRGFAYYTGPIFHLYAPGPGEAIGSGGRYDELLARFGAPMPAVGFALDTDRLAWALGTANVAPEPHPRAVFVGAPGDERLGAVRAQGVEAVAVEGRAAALAYARAWGFSVVVDGTIVIDVATGHECPKPFVAGRDDPIAHLRPAARMGEPLGTVELLTAKGA